MSRISPEKSNFARTCNLLNHYLKEKGSPRDLNLGIHGKVETLSAAKTTIDFLSEKPSQISTTQHVKPLNLFPQQAETEPKNAQMTIFYGGRVLVFDEFSADRAKELMELATKAVTVTPSTTIGNCADSTSSVGSVSQSKSRYRLQSDLPLARTTSLHRFLSKRKERACARGPYQLHNPSADSRKQQFDLNF